MNDNNNNNNIWCEFCNARFLVRPGTAIPESHIGAFNVFFEPLPGCPIVSAWICETCVMFFQHHFGESSSFSIVLS